MLDHENGALEGLADSTRYSSFVTTCATVAGSDNKKAAVDAFYQDPQCRAIVRSEVRKCRLPESAGDDVFQEVATVLYTSLLDRPMEPPHGIYGSIRLTARNRCWGRTNKKSELLFGEVGDGEFNGELDSVFADKVLFDNALADTAGGSAFIDPIKVVEDDLDRESAISELQAKMHTFSISNPKHRIANCWVDSQVTPLVGSLKPLDVRQKALYAAKPKPRRKLRPFKDSPAANELNAIRTALGMSMDQFAKELGHSLGRMQNLIYGSAEVDGVTLREARALKASDNSGHTKLMEKWNAKTMAEIVDMWGALIASTYSTRETPGSYQAMIVHVLSTPEKPVHRSTVWRWGNSRPSVENLELYDKRIRAFVENCRVAAAAAAQVEAQGSQN